ncbi:WD40 repeat domain-containing protein [Nocardioides rubriscoriae]|uniref:WD40 repeat domain-containing protein n=1 Tax=Nocardioides rubriscoriae TaxID=642762 RepID=UPI0011DF815F|nr:WD40 repeat domain-containing protein [Nocardioides rubriscoriae]
MNRTLVTLLATAAVLGTTGGTLAATRLAADGGPARDPGGPGVTARPSTTPSTTAATAGSTPREPVPPGAPAGRAPGAPGDVLWANQRGLHDGDQVVPLDLDDRLASLERADGAWVITTATSPQEPSYEVSVVRGDGTVTFLADTFGDGDVSPDGTRYVAMVGAGGGYGVWDIATGEQVDGVTHGQDGDQFPSGGAQFVDDDTVATTWSGDDAVNRVLLSNLGSADRQLVGSDVAGSWAISPEGGYFATTSSAGQDLDTGFADCALVSPTGGPDDALVDCGSTFAGRPSFAPDGDTVLTLPAGTDGFGPALLRPVGTGDGKPREAIVVPEATLDGAYLRDGVVVVLGAKNYDGDGTVISTCTTRGCEEVARVGDAAGTAVLGRTT